MAQNLAWRASIGLIPLVATGWVGCGGRAELDEAFVQGGGASGLASADGDGDAGSRAAADTGGPEPARGVVCPGPDLTPACPGLPVGEDANELIPDACLGIDIELHIPPFHGLLVVDRSEQMAVTAPSAASSRWQVVTEAVGQFARHDDLRRESLGLMTYDGLYGAVCDPDYFIIPDVAIRNAPDVAEAIESALASREPQGEAQPRAALGGALQLAEIHQLSWPDAAAYVVLIAGPGTASCEEPLGAEELVEWARRESSALPLLNALLLDSEVTSEDECTTLGDRVLEISSAAGPEALLNALLAVRSEIGRRNAPCVFEIPDQPDQSSGIQYGATRVVYDSIVDGVLEVPLVATSSECGRSEGGGFYFDNYDEVGKPHRLSLCPCSCAALGDAGVAPSITFSCQGGWPRAD